jgi:carboxylesterase
MSPSYLPGCEPLLTHGTDTGVLVLHGYSGLPTSVRPWADAFAEAGFSVAMPVLAGHGTSAEDLARATWTDFVTGVRAAYAELASRVKRIVVAGLSMGGGLTALLAEEAGAELAGVILVNPWILGLTDDALALIVDAVAGGVTLFGDADGPSDIKREGDKRFSYGYAVLPPLPAVHEGLQEVRARLGTITVPSLLFTSREDHTISNESSVVYATEVGGTVTQHWLDESWHVATVDTDAPFVFAESIRFCREVHA